MIFRGCTMSAYSIVMIRHGESEWNKVRVRMRDRDAPDTVFAGYPAGRISG
jgi:hypothetical protein